MSLSTVEASSAGTPPLTTMRSTSPSDTSLHDDPTPEIHDNEFHASLSRGVPDDHPGVALGIEWQHASEGCTKVWNDINNNFHCEDVEEALVGKSSTKDLLLNSNDRRRQVYFAPTVSENVKGVRLLSEVEKEKYFWSEQEYLQQRRDRLAIVAIFKQYAREERISCWNDDYESM